MINRKGELIARAANPLLKAKKECTKIQRKILYIAISQIGYDDKNFIDVTIPKKDIVKMLGGTREYYSQLRSICNDLFSKKIVIEDNPEAEHFDMINIFARMRYDKEEGLYFKFSEEMKPYLIDLKQRYATTPLMRVLCLDSNHAIALYELMLAEIWPGKDHFTITVDRLKRFLNVENNKSYERMSNFRIFCLDKPLQEINDKLGAFWHISYKAKKEGRKIIEFIFTVIDKTRQDAPQLPDPATTKDLELYGGFIKKMVELTSNSIARGRFTERSAKKFLLTERPSIEVLIYSLEAVNEYAAKQKKANKDFILSSGAITKAIKNVWRPNSTYYKSVAKKAYEKLIQQRKI